jgi:uncharacterized protein YgiM (DUF1202 family)
MQDDTMKIGTGLTLLFLCGCGTVATQPPPDTTLTPVASYFPDTRTVVTGREVNLRQGPGTVYAIVGCVHAGDTLVVLGEAGDWYRVYFAERSLFAWIFAGLTSGAELP